MFDLQKIFELWLKCTGKNVSDGKIRIGIESDWLCHEASRHLETDPSGLLSGITMRAAYRKFIKEHQITIEDLVSGEWDRIKDNWAAILEVVHLPELLGSLMMVIVYLSLPTL